MSTHTSFGSRRYRTVTCTLLLSLGTACAAQSGPVAAGAPKNPKLSSVIAELRSAVSQSAAGTTGAAFPEIKETSPQLSPNLREAFRGRMLRADAVGNIEVDIQLDRYDAWSASELRAVGFQQLLIGRPDPNKNIGEVYSAAIVVEGWLPAAAIDLVAALPNVRYLQTPNYGVSSSGSVDTQGDHILQADVARSTLNIDGTGVRIGVIASGIGGIFATGCTTACNATSSVPSPVTLGDLPTAVGVRNAAGTLVSVSGSITAPKSYRTDGDLEDASDGSAGAEGTAMLEIVHDLAPGAALYFANASTSLQFEQAVDALASTTDIVVDDVSWFTPPFDGTSAVSTNTSDALNNNAYPVRAYFTASGNWAQDHYQGAYTDSGVDGFAVTGAVGDLHLFQGAASVILPAPGVTTDNGNFGKVTFDPLIAIPPGENVSVYLTWNDPELASTNDYDLFLVPLSCAGVSNAKLTPPCQISGPPLVKGLNPQTGVQSPAEQLTWINGTSSAATVGIVIQNARNLAQPRTLDLFVNGYGAKSSTSNHNFNTVTGSIPAQGDAGGGVVTVGAINQKQCIVPATCTNLLEAFSSQGPTEITPQSLNGTMKPDLVAVDQVCVTGAGGFNTGAPPSGCPPTQLTSYTPVPFGGSSAAAPHAAAAAGLVLQAAPCLLNGGLIGTPTNARTKLRGSLTSNAHSLPGYFETVPNSLEGWGLVDALDAAASMLPVANPLSSTPIVLSATSSMGASLAITPSGIDPNGCPVVSVAWSGACGTGSAQSPHATLQCPIGTNTVQAAVSNNGRSYPPPAQVPNSTVIVTDFVLSASPMAITVQPGATLLFNVTALSSPQGQFANPIALTCSSGLPAGSTCSFAPGTINAANSTGTTASTSSSTLTIYTSGIGRVKALPPKSSSREIPGWAVAFLFPVLLAAPARLRTATSRTALVAFTAFMLVTVMTGCGAKTQPSSPTTYTVTVAGTSNQLQHTTTISFTVQ